MTESERHFLIFVVGIISGMVLMTIIGGLCVSPHEIEVGRHLGPCQAHGGQMVDGVCAKVEPIDGGGR